MLLSSYSACENGLKVTYYKTSYCHRYNKTSEHFNPTCTTHNIKVDHYLLYITALIAETVNISITISKYRVPSDAKNKLAEHVAVKLYVVPHPQTRKEDMVLFYI